ncbi:hypothetical protein PHYPSEUDO_013203 [Phytophthora pseudosyringae]|uniref:Uncharacterized protein n=1 Tax=Phytophthora pseudosyringae TaxID=221518 RepID=A0A8T1V877_9STRA|nr:hypothetical protein PHYPSEUDO_013203 [Phytophthora pseudosyringae]
MIELENANDDDVLGLDDDVISLTPRRSRAAPPVLSDDDDDEDSTAAHPVPGDVLVEPSSGVSSSRQSAADAPPASVPPSQASRAVLVVHSETLVEAPVSNSSTGIETSVYPTPAILDASGHGYKSSGPPLTSSLTHSLVGHKPRKKAKVTTLVIPPTNATIRQVQLSESSLASLPVRSQTKRNSSKKGRAKSGTGSRRTSSSRDVVTSNASSSAVTPLSLVPRSYSILRFTRPVSKWAQPYVSLVFSLPGALACWTRILNYRQSAPVPKKVKVPCAVKCLIACVDYKNPKPPWQLAGRRYPQHAYFFDTHGFDQNGKVSRCAPSLLRLRSYWRNFRGYGKKDDAELGFSFWEYDHWVPTRTVTLFFKAAHRILAENTTLSDDVKLQIKMELERVKALWYKYDKNRIKRCDRLRVKLVYTIREWCVINDTKLEDILPEVLFEPSVPGYSLEYLTWIPSRLTG